MGVKGHRAALRAADVSRCERHTTSVQRRGRGTNRRVREEEAAAAAAGGERMKMAGDGRERRRERDMRKHLR